MEDTGRAITGMEVGMATEEAWPGVEEMVRGQIVVDTEMIWVVIWVLVAGQLVALGWQEMTVCVSVA